MHKGNKDEYQNVCCMGTRVKYAKKFIQYLVEKFDKLSRIVIEMFKTFFGKDKH